MSGAALCVVGFCCFIISYVFVLVVIPPIPLTPVAHTPFSTIIKLYTFEIEQIARGL